MPRWRTSISTLRVLLTAMSRPRGWVILNQFAEPIELSLATGETPFFSWSQDGEDVVLMDVVHSSGIYVDVGAHHPTRFSVTRHLYEAGWHGVNIDASPGFAALFETARPRDINVESLVGNPGTRDFYRFIDPAYSTLDSNIADELRARGVEMVGVEELQVQSLASILHEVLMPQPIGLLSIDVEGADLEVLQSHDFDAYPPERVLVECPVSVDELPTTDVHRFLASRGFEAIVVLKRSVLYRKSAPA